MGTRTIVAFVVGALAMLTPTLAWALEVTATVNRTEVTLQDRVTLTVSVEGARGVRPALPPLPDFDVMRGGESTQFQLSNGRQSLSTAFTFFLLPKKVGTFTIGPVTVSDGAQTATSRPFELQVLAADAAPATERTVFITGTVSNDAPFVGEPVTYRFRLYRRVRTGDANLEMPDFSGFLLEDLGQQREYQSTVKGQTYNVTEIAKALVPQRAGTHEIGGAALQIQVVVEDGARRRRGFFDDFFGATRTEAKTLRSSPVTLNVRSLPPEPAGFSGLVGVFKLAGSVSRDTLAAGESTTVTLTVAGTGNVQIIPEPVMEPPGEHFKVYDDKPTGSRNTRGDVLRGTRTWTKSLVPLQAGTLEVPRASLTWFDPESERYRTAHAGPFPLQVTPAQAGEELALTEGRIPGAGKVAVRVLGDDLLPSYRRVDGVSGPPRVWLVALAGAIPPLFFLGLLGQRRRDVAHQRDAGLRRRRSASRRARGAVRAIDGEPKERAAAASRVLRTWIGDKLGREGGALTPDEAGAALIAAGMEPAIAERVADRLRAYEAAAFGVGDVADVSVLRKDVLTLLGELERVLR